MKHLNRRSEIKGINRKDIYEIPFEALREAIAGLPTPRIRQNGFYTIVFKRPVESETKKDAEDIAQKSTVKILEAIKENKNISAKEIAENIGLSLSGVEKQLAKLKQEGILTRIGPDKGGHWEIVKDL